MATTIAFSNYGTKTVAHNGIMMGVSAFASGSPGTASRVYKQVNADDNNGNFDTLAASGVTITEDGTYRAGREAVTATGTVALTSHVVDVDTTAGVATLTLQPAATVGAGFKMWIHLRVDGGDLTVDGDAAELVLGAATQTLAAAGDLLLIESDGVSAWVAHT